MTWKQKILELLENNPRTKEDYLRGVLEMINRGGEQFYPTAPQIYLLNRFWNAHEKRKELAEKQRIEEIIGFI